jgi:small subunit ribosomal protein S17
MRTKEGTVVSNTMEKTVGVQFERYVTHPIYKKRHKKTNKVLAHTEENIEIGDIVVIQECRPYSKRKNWQVIEVKKAA